MYVCIYIYVYIYIYTTTTFYARATLGVLEFYIGSYNGSLEQTTTTAPATTTPTPSTAPPTTPAPPPPPGAIIFVPAVDSDNDGFTDDLDLDDDNDGIPDNIDRGTACLVRMKRYLCLRH